MKKNTWGGKRPNAGPKLKYGEPIVRMYVPKSLVATILTMLKEFRERKI